MSKQTNYIIWPLTKKLGDLLVKADKRMLRYMARVSLRHRVTNEDLLCRCGLECISTTLYRKKAWLVPCSAPRGKPKMVWCSCVDSALQISGLTDGENWTVTNGDQQ